MYFLKIKIKNVMSSNTNFPIILVINEHHLIVYRDKSSFFFASICYTGFRREVNIHKSLYTK